MCLDSVTRTLESATLIESGWKNFSGSKGLPQFSVFTFQGKKNVPLDEWITAEETKVVSHSPYTSGFHIYADETEKSFKDLGTMRRVYFRKAHTRGMQSGVTVIIVREMFVPSDPDAWPPRS